MKEAGARGEERTGQSRAGLRTLPWGKASISGMNRAPHVHSPPVPGAGRRVSPRLSRGAGRWRGADSPDRFQVGPHHTRVGTWRANPGGRPGPALPDCSRLWGGASGSHPPPPSHGPFREGPARRRDLLRGERGVSPARSAPQTPARRQVTRPLPGASQQLG